MTPKQYDALGSLLLPGTGPHGLKSQLHKATAKRFIDAGLVVEREVTLPGRFPVTIKQHDLTMLGNITYCDWAAKQPGEAP